LKHPAFFCWQNRALILGIFLLMNYSCNNKKTTVQEKNEKGRITLNEKTIFDFRMVQRARRGANHQEKALSNKLFQQAAETYKSRKDTFQAINKLKASIIAYPHPDVYFELGSIFLEHKAFDSAQKALNISELLNYNDLPALYYKLAKVHAARKEVEETNKYLELALVKGFRDISSLTKDPDFKNIKTSEEYRGLIADNVSNEAGRKEALFEVFVSHFPKIKLPFRIEKSETRNFNYGNYIPYDFEELLVEMIRKEESKEYSYVGIIDSTAKYIAVIYSSIDAIEEDNTPATESYLVVYDKKGKIIDNLLFACACSPAETYAGLIDKKKKIRVTRFKNTAEYDGPTTDLSGNGTESSISQYTYYYKITREGRIKFEKKVEEEIIARI